MFGITKVTWGVISTVLFGLFVGYQYFDSKWKARIERSLDYAVLYQEPEKVAARNASDLWPPTSTATGLAVDLSNVKDAANDPSVSDVNVLDGQNAWAIQASKITGPELPKGSVEQTGATHVAPIAFPDGVKCENNIEWYSDEYFDEYYKNVNGAINSNSEYITPIGTVKDYGGDRYWLLDDVYYHYTLPDLLREFFYTDSKKFNVKEEDREDCVDLVDEIESTFTAASPDILSHLHELKHFYAAVSICTTSGLCDSRVACEIFLGDIHRFQKAWNKYFELWAASNGEAEYWRLPQFSSHCMSNKLFKEYSERKLNWYGRPMLNAAGFTNFW